MRNSYHVSNLNFLPEVNKNWFLPERVYITDETLREGEETPGAIMSNEDKLKIAEKLESIGVYETNVGYVCSINDHAVFSKMVNEKCIKMKTSCYLRVYGERGDFKDKVKFAQDTGVDRIVVIVPASEYQFKVKENCNMMKAFEDGITAVRKAKECGVKITYAPYDTTRADLDYLKLVYKTAAAEGADRLLAFDTLGVMNPQATFYWIRQIKETIDLPIQYHCHNDFGLAVANTCAAVTAGVEYLDIVINGLGDRAGNANFEETIISLEGLYRVNTGIDTSSLFEVCKFVESLTQIKIPVNKAVSGKNTFVHESDIHVSALLTGNADAFEPYDPEVVGQKRTIYFGSTTSIDSVETMAKNMNINIEKEQGEAIMDKIKLIINDKGYATDEEVRQLIMAEK